MTTKAKFEAPLRMIDPEIIASNPSNPRADLGDMAELTASIQAHGIIQPILVRPVEGGYMVVAGSRRLAAATALELKEIPCHVRELDDDQAHELALMENIIRKDMTLIDEIRAVERLALTGESHTEIAARFGRTARWVSTRKKIADMPKIVLEKIAEGALSIADAEILCRLNDRDAIAEIVESSDDVAESVNAYLRELADAPWVDAKSECAKCLLRSDKQASLFDDGGPARCMDSRCWEEKRSQWIAKKERELREVGHLPKETWHHAYSMEQGYSGYLLEGRDDKEIAELVEAGVKPRFHITPENEVLLRYFYPDLPEKTVKTASGDEEPEVEEATEEDYAFVNGKSNYTEDSEDEEPEEGESQKLDEEEEPAEPSPFALRRAANERARAIREIAFERINVQDVQWFRLLPFIAEVIRLNTSGPLDDVYNEINAARVTTGLPEVDGLEHGDAASVEDGLLRALFAGINNAALERLVKACGMDWDELEKSFESEEAQA